MIALRLRVALALATGCIAAVALYAVVRAAQFLFTAEPNPATVIWSAHAGYFWRVWIVCYVGGMAAFCGFLAAGRAPERLARALSIAVTAAAILIAVQGLLLP
jgi:hypothetical protein